MLKLNVHAVEMAETSKLTPGQRMRLLWRLQRYVVPYWDKVLLRVVSGFAMSFLMTVPALLAPYLMDDALPNRNWDLVVRLALIGMVLTVLTRVLGVVSGIERAESALFPTNIMSSYTMPRIAVAIRDDFLRHVQSLSMGFFSARPVGEHMFRAGLDCDDAAYLASEFIPKTVAVIQRVIILLMVIQGFGSWLVLPVTIYLVIFFTVKQKISTGIRRWDRGYRVETQRLDAVTREVLVPWKLVKACTLEPLVKLWYGLQATRSARALFMRSTLVTVDGYFTFVAIQVFVAVLMVVTGTKIVGGTMTIGEQGAVIGLVVTLIGPFQEMIATFQIFRQKFVPAERLMETLEIRPSVADPAEPRELGSVEGGIELRNVSFAYPNGVEVLHGVSLVANPGEKVALVGPTGAGKSTLLSLIVRLHDATAGQVLVDGVDVRDLRQADLRRPMAYVPQSIETFTETIAENIRYGNPRATREAVERAARLARVNEFADDLPGGLDTLLGEGGSLSGGQRQRVCLARALVRDSRVLLLDEATSALDPVTEREVVAGVDAEYADRTRIVVAHNLLNARSADRIYVLDQGRIVESGTHDELMAARGLYRRLLAADAHDTPAEDKA